MLFVNGSVNCICAFTIHFSYFQENFFNEEIILWVVVFVVATRSPIVVLIFNENHNFKIIPVFANALWNSCVWTGTVDSTFFSYEFSAVFRYRSRWCRHLVTLTHSVVFVLTWHFKRGIYTLHIGVLLHATSVLSTRFRIVPLAKNLVRAVAKTRLSLC